MNVYQALLDDFLVLIEAELLSRHDQVELSNEIISFLFNSSQNRQLPPQLII